MVQFIDRAASEQFFAKLGVEDRGLIRGSRSALRFKTFDCYYHRIDPSQGFVFQRVYTDERDLDESHAAEDHDVVVVPRGYHPVVVPWGYRSYYLNVMAGPVREWRISTDPAYA